MISQMYEFKSRYSKMKKQIIYNKVAFVLDFYFILERGEKMQILKEDIKQKIIEAGKKKFKKDGYANTSMKDIATDVGISTGNIYRYFLTKSHLYNEIVKELETEIENFFNKVPTKLEDVKPNELFDMLIDMTVNIAETKKDTLKVMLMCDNEKQYVEFKNKVLSMFIDKIQSIAESFILKGADHSLCEAVARAHFEGFTCIVKNNIDDIELLKKNLKIYEKLMIENMDVRFMEVIKNVR